MGDDWEYKTVDEQELPVFTGKTGWEFVEVVISDMYASLNKNYIQPGNQYPSQYSDTALQRVSRFLVRRRIDSPLEAAQVAMANAQAVGRAAQDTLKTMQAQFEKDLYAAKNETVAIAAVHKRTLEQLAEERTRMDAAETKYEKIVADLEQKLSDAGERRMTLEADFEKVRRQLGEIRMKEILDA